ncbi:hypothetical protein JWG39_05175 [Desulforhopalus vacuolatus]|uniref:hypothetical protein n=1 Tax=Desulforhopalus vacuolatus TaxID=40414 RepID=UPI001965AAC9|nr:hypothetical protein [Desulforhopalus vacuolatus]MBM9519211.1 hypothetical protein [Desulforhopalus vacuolatus]
MKKLHRYFYTSMSIVTVKGKRDFNPPGLILLVLLLSCFFLTGTCWSDSNPSMPSPDVTARTLQLEGTQLQLKGDVQGAVLKYRQSLGLKPNKKLENIVLFLEQRLDHSVKKILFDGKLEDQWLELSASGGNYSEFAQIKNNALVVDVPEGNSWGKTGIRSRNELFTFPDKNKAEAIKLTFDIDVKESSDFVYAVIPGNWDGNLEWRSHFIRLQANKNKDGKTVTLSLIIRKSEKMKAIVNIEQIARLNVIIRSDNIVEVTDKNDSNVLQAIISGNENVYKYGYKISALTHANESNLPAKLMLKKISLEKVKYIKQTDTSILSNITGKTILFDGKLMGHQWIRYKESRDDYDKTVRLADGALLVDVPEDSGYANVGIESSHPLIWLDAFGEGSEREVVFDFLPDETTGFAIALSYRDNHFIVKWVKDSACDTALLQIYVSENLGLIGNWNSSYTPVWEQKLTAKAPSRVKLALTPEGVHLSGDNLPEHLQYWKFLKANAGYKIYAYSFPLLPDKAVKMALKQISLHKNKLVPAAQIEAVENVEPLPVKTFFDGSKVQDWTFTPWQIYKEPVTACHLDEKGFSVFDVPTDTPLDGCDIHTTEPLITIDERIDTTSYKVTAEFDAKTTKNFQVVITPHTRSKWNKYYEACYVQLFQNKHSENIFSLNCGGNKNYWQRTVSDEWLTSEWDGKLTILIEKEWLQAQIGNGQAIRIAHTSPSNIYIYVVALDYRYADTKTAFMLKSISGQWQAPEGMKTVDRWFYIDTSDFNPEQFIKDLASDLPYPNAPILEGEYDEK